MEKWEGRRVYRRQKGQKAVLGQREKRRLIQLGICMFLFLTVFFTKGGERTAHFREELKEVLQTNADFVKAISRLGQARQSGRPVGETLGAFWVQVFLPQAKEPYISGQDGPLFLQAKAELTGTNEAGGLLRRGTGFSQAESEESTASTEEPRPEETETPQAEETPSPEWLPSNYDGPDLPEKADMDWYDLHLEETVAPVSAVMTSPFGWRIDPFGDEQKFHYGLDLGVPTGTDVLAFAAGTVEYIGESDIFGQYLQIDHGNGIKTFYAHCSKLCVRQGKTVAAGEKVAESGSTGNSTGPHLHLELKRDGMYLNPLHYVDVLT